MNRTQITAEPEIESILEVEKKILVYCFLYDSLIIQLYFQISEIHEKNFVV